MKRSLLRRRSGRSSSGIWIALVIVGMAYAVVPAATTGDCGNRQAPNDGTATPEAPVSAVETMATIKAQDGAYDPNTKVYCDHLWFRVHAEDCPDLILKEKKKTTTLEEADKAGARIGESGQSGRDDCCFQGYRRKYPKKKFTDDTLLCGNDLKKNVKHLAGCHRYAPDRSHLRRTMKEWLADGFHVCGHCKERGPSLTTVSDEAWKKLGSSTPFVAPEGWVPKPYPTDKLPSKSELEIFIQETLAIPNGIQELPFADPIASMEHFVCMRFFFPVTNWLTFYQAYRATGDKRVLDRLLESARHYHKVSVEYPSVVQKKASDPEGLPYMLSMAACARITLQLARKYPDKVSKEDREEAEAFLRTMISVLKPTYEGSDSLDPEMGLPKKVADDFRTRAFNRAMNGIGTLSMISAALEDLQALKKTKEYQPQIDRYRKTVREYIKHWFSHGHFCKFNGRNHFYYPYSPREGEPRVVDGCKILGRPEDAGHYTHCLQGVVFIYQSTRDLGIDDDFLTAVANAVYQNATEARTKVGNRRAGLLQCPTGHRVNRKSMGGKNFSPARDRFYVLNAFRDDNDLINGLCSSLSEQRKTQANSDYEKRVATLYAQYVKALRKDRSVIHLGEKAEAALKQ